MAIIQINNATYFSRGSSSTREYEYEDAILKESKRLFPNLRIAKFKYDLTNGFETRKPDLIYINDSFTSWGIIEVELSHHSMEDHILPQIKILSMATFPSSKIPNLANQLGVNSKNLESLIKFEPAVNYIIIDKYVDNLKREASKYNFKVCIVEIFESFGGEIAYRINGDNFLVNADIKYSISHTHKNGIFRSNNRIESISKVIYSGSVFDCEIAESKGYYWMIVNDFPEKEKGSFALLNTKDGNWILIAEDS